MAYVRWLHSRKFDPVTGRFNSSSFENGTKRGRRGFSLVDSECVESTGRTLCEHALKYYRKHNTVDADNPIFWMFTPEILPPSEEIDSKITSNRDPCHRTVWGVPDQDVYEFFVYSDPSAHQYRRLSEFMYCDDSGIRTLTVDDVTRNRDRTENNA